MKCFCHLLLVGCATALLGATGCNRISPATASVGTNPGAAANPSGDLASARANFQTKVTDNPNYQSDGPVDQPPPKFYKVVKYPAPGGALAAYLSPDPGDGKKHPAVVYAHGGFGGINGLQWGKEQFAPFRDAGFVLMCPSWRGENQNPGQYEMFYGEVDDAVAAVAYLSKIPYVDATRIYMVGHSTGGTITLLTAETTPLLRAAFSFGGAPDLEHADYGNTPFDRKAPGEVRLRSAVHFVEGLKAPTFYFEGNRNVKGQRDDGYLPDALKMQEAARRLKKPLTVYPVEGGNHFTILQPICVLLAQKLQADTGANFDLSLTADEVNRAYSPGGPR